MTHGGRQPQRGAALLIFLILFVMAALTVVVTGLSRQDFQLQRAQQTTAALKLAKDALLAYAATYRDSHPNEVPGYLLCPDTDGDGDGDAMDDCGSQDVTVVGLLPYKTLGLPDLRDADGNCLWYAVSGRFKNDPKTAALNWDTQGQLTVQSAGGAILAVPEDAHGGAAAAIIAPGAPLAGQSRTPTVQICGVSPAEVAAYLESTLPNLTDGVAKDVNGATLKNDAVAWITPREIFTLLKRRSDYAGQLDTLIGELETGLKANYPAGYPSPQNAQSKGDKQVGEVPATTAVSAAWQKYRDNWRDQFRYVLCNTPTAPCLTVNGANCAGALLFAGERPAGGPRTAAEKADLGTFLDAANLTAWNDTANAPPADAFAGASVASSISPAADVLRCLPPIPGISLAQDIANFSKAGDVTAVTIDTTAKTITLGKEAVGATSGCAWYAPAIPFGNGLRIYLRFRTAIELNGFTFALADAVRSDAAYGPGNTGMCGDAGAFLGYAGGGIPVLPPKLGLELDMWGTSGWGDPGTGSEADDHLGILLWGPIRSDDAKHNVAINNTLTGTPTQLFPLPSDNSDIHVRLDIARSYAAGSGSYDIKAYAATSFSSCLLNQFQNLAQDLASQCAMAPTVSSGNINITDPADGLGEALRNVYPGFTFGQTGNQKITIHDLRIQLR